MSLSVLPDVNYGHQDRAQPLALSALPATDSTFTDEPPQLR